MKGFTKRAIPAHLRQTGADCGWRQMKPAPKRRRFAALGALIVGASIAVPVTTATASSGATQDKIVFVQTSNHGNVAPYVEYEGANGVDQTQSLSVGSGACESSKLSNPTSPLLPLSAAYYSTSSEESASVGSEVTGGVAETGVCFNSRTSTGETIVPDEGLIFSVGQSNSLTSGRLFSEATIPLKNNSFSASTSGTLILRQMSGGVETTVDTVSFKLPPGGQESPGDTTDCPVISTGVVSAAAQFDQLEIQVKSGSASVVGPSCDNDNDNDDQAVPTFYLDSTPAITSYNSATFFAGTAGSFTVSSTGYPTPTLSDAAFAAKGSQASCTPSTLPSGLTFTPSTTDPGTATIASTSAFMITSPSGPYTYIFCINASNDAGTALQTFTLTVDQGAGIASANNTTFTAGSPGTFTVTTTGFPNPTLSDTTGFIGCPESSLPTGVTFTPNSNGTATITGTPAASTASAGTSSGPYTYTVCITASNTFGTPPATYPATQTFTLTVDQAPSFTNAAAATFTSNPSGAMTMGQNGSFPVTAAGDPAPALSVVTGSGCSSLPSGVTFTDEGGGMGTIAGTPANGTEGTYSVCLTATNTFVPFGALSPSTFVATQTFTLTIAQAPVITSTDSNVGVAGATFTAGSSDAGTTSVAGSSFTVTTTGNPVPTLSDTGSTGCTAATSLPNGVTFTANSNGTATIAGTPAIDTGGLYPICITAANTIGTTTYTSTQTFMLTVDQAPAITSTDNVIVPAGDSFTFGPPTAGVTTSGYPTPTLNDNGFTGCTTDLPTDLATQTSPTFFTDNGDGTATMAGMPASTDGSTTPYPVCINATNAAGTATQDFSLDITSQSAQLTATPQGVSEVTASLQLDSGDKSFLGFTTSTTSKTGNGGTATVTFTTPTDETSMYTATLNINWGNLAYCVPYASTSPPTCQPASVTIGPPGSTAVPVLACPSGTPPATPPLNTWCSEGASYSYVTSGGTEYTNIVETIYGSGDVTFNHG